MHESVHGVTPPLPSGAGDASAGLQVGGAAPTGDLTDPRALQILTTEHWSLLSARALVYNEAFSRASMFLAFLSMSFVALGLVGPVMAFSREFLLLAAVILSFDLVIGLGTYGRVVRINTEDFTAIAGMNRIRHGYVDIAPAVAPYLSTSVHDDIRGVFATYGGWPARRGIAGMTPGLTTTTGMVGTIVALVAGVLAGVLGLALTGSPPLAVALAALVTVVAFALLARHVWSSIRETGGTLSPRFPSGEAPDDGAA